MSLLHYLLLIFSVLLGGAIGFAMKTHNKKNLQIVLSFSGAYVLGITVLHIMPSIYTDHAGSSIGIWVLGGFLLQLILETMSGGIEHGHIHHSEHLKPGMIISIMIGLCIHAFLEGLPLNGYMDMHDTLHYHEGLDDHSPLHFLYGIILHKAPAAFTLVLLLLLSKVSKLWTVICLLIFASMSPLGAFIASFLDLSIESLRILLAIVVGSFLHIATTILFEIDNTDHHRISIVKLVAILLGVGLSVLTIH